jgi:hypothetical protein
MDKLKVLYLSMDDVEKASVGWLVTMILIMRSYVFLAFK